MMLKIIRRQTFEAVMEMGQLEEVLRGFRHLPMNYIKCYQMQTESFVRSKLE